MISDIMKQAIENLPVIISIKEAADFFQVAYITIYRLIHRKELAAYKDNENNWCILRDDFLKFCKKICNL